jgi:hypothetical protein
VKEYKTAKIRRDMRERNITIYVTDVNTLYKTG